MADVDADAATTSPPKKRRKTYTNRQKHDILRAAQPRLAQGESLRAICREFNIQPSQYRRWKQAENELAALPPHARSTNRGRPSCLQEIEEPLLQWFFQLSREQGMSVSTNMVVLKASELDDTFKDKTTWSKLQAVRRFIKVHRLVIRDRRPNDRVQLKNSAAESL